MIDRLFTAALTFCLLVAGTLAIASTLFETGQPATPARVVQLPAVEMHVVQLPTVEVVGRRAAPGTSVARTSNPEPATNRVQ